MQLYTCNGQTSQQIAAALNGYFAEADIQWKPDRFTGGKQPGPCKAIMLAFVDNRAIMERLDEVCGPGNWQSECIPWGPNAAKCTLSLLFVSDREAQWVSRTDVCENSQVSPVKGGVSGAMKRAAAQWGIGRYLYHLPDAFLPATKDANGRGKLDNYGQRPPVPAKFLPGNERPRQQPDYPVKQPEPVAQPQQQRQQAPQHINAEHAGSRAEAEAPAHVPQQQERPGAAGQGGKPTWWDKKNPMKGPCQGMTWGEISQGSPGGKREEFATFYCSLDPYKGEPRWHASNLESLEAAKYCLKAIGERAGNQPRPEPAEEREYARPEDVDWDSQSQTEAQEWERELDDTPF
jgi:hypothetical protein